MSRDFAHFEKQKIYHGGRNYHIINSESFLSCKKYIIGKLTRKQLCNAMQCPHGMLCHNAKDYITEEIIGKPIM